jgi:hypothetical protein
MVTRLWVVALPLSGAAVVFGACGAGDRVFGFPSPPPESTCQEARDYMRANFGPPGELAEGILFNPGPEFGPLARPAGPLDFFVVVENTQSREGFLRRRGEVEQALADWLAPAGLDLEQFRILWVADPELKYRRSNGGYERDPETGAIIVERLEPADRLSGAPCPAE